MCKPKTGNESVGPDGTYLFPPFSQLTASAGWNMECGGRGRRRRGPEQSAGEMKGTGQMGRLGQLRPAQIAKTRGAGADEVILHPSRARGRRGKLCWSATSAKVVKVYLGANNAGERIWEFAKVRTGEWPSVIMVKSYLSPG